MFGIGLPELIILFVIAAIIISPIVIVILVLAHVRKKKESKSASAKIQPPPLPKLNEIDLINEAQLLFREKNYKSAINTLTRAIKINNECDSAFFNRGVVFLKMGNTERAINDLKTAAKLGHEKSKELLNNKGISY